MAIETYGWDLVYAMRFPAVNAALQTNFNQEDLVRQALRQTLLTSMAVPSGYVPAQARVAGLLATAGTYLYTQTPTLHLGAVAPGQHTLVPLLRVAKVDIVADGGGFTPGDAVVFEGGGTTPAPQQATGELMQVIRSVTVDDAGLSAYTSAPTISFVGGSGSGAAAIATLNGFGFLAAIQVTNQGSGYDATNLPTVVITGGGGSGAAATAVAGLGIRLTNPGKNYTSPPTVRHQTGTGLVATVFVQLDDIGGDTLYGSDFQSPVLTVERAASDTQPQRYDAATGMYVSVPATETDKAFSTFFYATPDRLLSTGDTGAKFLLRLLKAALVPVLQKIGAGCELLPRNGTVTTQVPAADITTAMDAVVVVATDPAATAVEQWVRAAHEKLLSLVAVYKFNDRLALLQQATRDARYAAEAEHLVASTKKWPTGYPRTQQGLLKLLLAEETTKAVLRAKRALRNVDASLVFDYDAAATPTTDPATFLRPLNALPNPASNTRQQSIFVYNATEVALAVYPERYSTTLVGLGKIVQQVAFNLQKIRLYTEPWQLITGGTGGNLRLKVPVRAGALYFGRTPLALTPAHKLYFTLRVKLTWLKGASLTSQELQVDSVEVESLRQEAGGTPLPNWTQLQATLLEFLGNTLNPKRNPTDKAKSNLLAPVDYAFSFNHTFAALNKFEHVAEAEAEFAWMYPTTASYCVKDEDEDEPDPQNSLLAVCCMTQGHVNPNAANVDLRAIPQADSAAVLISKEQLLEHFVLPYVVMLFQHPDGSPATLADFRLVNNQAYANKVPLTTLALGIELEKDKPLAGEAAPNALLLEVREGLITLTLRELNYSFTRAHTASLFSPERELETKARVSKTFGFTFGLPSATQANGAKQLTVNPMLLDSSFSLEPADAAGVTIWEVLGAAGLSVLSTFIVSVMFAGVAEGGRYLKGLRNGRRVQGTPIEIESALSQRRDVGQNLRIEGLRLKPAFERELPNIRDSLVKVNLVGEYTSALEHTRTADYRVVKLNYEGSVGNLHHLELELRAINGNPQHGTFTYRVEYNEWTEEASLLENNPREANEQLREQFKAQILPVIETALVPQGARRLPAVTQVELVNLDSSTHSLMDRTQPAGTSLRERREAMREAAQPGALPRVVQRASGSTFSFEAVTALVGTSLAGGLVWMYYSDVDKRYQQYKSEASKALDNVMQNGITYLTNNLTQKIKWPTLQDQALELGSFFLDGSIVIGLKAVKQRRRLQGYVSVDNPSVPLVQMASDTTQLLVENTGNNPIRLSFVDNTGGYQGLLGHDVGQAVTVPPHSSRPVALAAFALPAGSTPLLCVSAEENDATYALTLH